MVNTRNENAGEPSFREIGTCLVTALAPSITTGTFATESTSMTFGEHIEELRVSLMRALLGLGLGMLIGVSTIEGMSPNDLQNINGLNHYIGMAAIEPESIPELQIMPWVFILA